jgi:hypothetical protein
LLLHIEKLPNPLQGFLQSVDISIWPAESVTFSAESVTLMTEFVTFGAEFVTLNSLQSTEILSIS